MSTSVQFSSLERDPHEQMGISMQEQGLAGESHAACPGPHTDPWLLWGVRGNGAGPWDALPCAVSQYPQAEESFEPVSSPKQML